MKRYCDSCWREAKLLVEGMPNSGARFVCYVHAYEICEANGDTLGAKKFYELAGIVSASLPE